MRFYLNHESGEFWLIDMLVFLNCVGYIKLDHCEIYYSINIAMWTNIYIMTAICIDSQFWVDDEFKHEFCLLWCIPKWDLAWPKH